MKVQLESTTKIVTLSLNGQEMPARVWEGVTESGIPVHAFITRIAAHEDTDLSQFEAELLEQRRPTAAVDRSYPNRLIL